MAKKFLCSDDSINAYGFRVLTKGINTKNFKNNPVGFLNHNTGGSSWIPDPNYSGPIIRWEELSKSDEALYATPVFDVNDDLGKKLNDKVENDFIRAASIGFRIIETSEDPELMLPGQTRPTVTKCDLIEISVVDIPANKNALALFDADNNRIDLDDNTLTTTLSFALKDKKALPTPVIKTNLMKLNFLKAWTGLLSFFGVEVPEGSEQVEAVVSADKLADLNNKINTLNDIQAQLTIKESEIALLTASLNDANKKVTDGLALVESANAEITTLKAEITSLKAPATEVSHPVKTGQENSDTQEEDDKNLSDEEKRAKLLNFDVKKVGLKDKVFFAE